MKQLVLFLFITNSIYGISQAKLSPPDSIPSAEDSVFNNEHLIIGERDPEAQFPGGPSALFTYISNEFDWECVNTNDSIIESSKVYLSFTVNEDGSVSNVSVAKGVNWHIDECCVDFIKQMPKWIPAENGSGKPIAQRVTLPIIICLN